VISSRGKSDIGQRWKKTIHPSEYEDEYEWFVAWLKDLAVFFDYKRNVKKQQLY
jgi:hypothetical protein